LHPFDTEPFPPKETTRNEEFAKGLGRQKPPDPQWVERSKLPDNDPDWQSQGMGLLRRILRLQEDFNALVDRSATAPSYKATTSTLGSETIERIRDVASTQASALDKKRDRVMLRLVLLIFAAAGLLGAFEHWRCADQGQDWSGACASPFLVFGSLIALLLIGLTYHSYRTSGTERDRYDLRALSEGLRVQAAWCTAGVPATVSAEYMQRQRGEMDWIRYVIQSISWPMERWTHAFTARDHSHKVQALKECIKGRVQHQRDYFHKNSSKADRNHHWFHHWGWTFGAAGMLKVV
jgi:hypothetical protein